MNELAVGSLGGSRALNVACLEGTAAVCAAGWRRAGSGRSVVEILPDSTVVAAHSPSALSRVAVPLAAMAVKGNRRLANNKSGLVAGVEEAEGADRL